MSKHRKRGGVARNRNTGRQDHWGAGDEIFDAEVDDGRFDEPSEYVLVSLEERAAEAARRAGVATERPSTDASWTDLDAASCVVVPTTDVSITLKDFKLKIADIIREYFTSEDVVECERALVELDASVFHFEFVKRAITMSMDFKDRERELVSRILSTFSSDVLRRHDIGKGFERVFEQLDDLVLDCPTAYTIVTQFLARAVADEALPPVFLADPLVQRLGGEVVDQAKVLLSMKHGLSRLEHVWGPGDGRSTADLKEAVLQLVQEYLAAGDMGEAARCIRELNAAPFHHEGACYFLPPQHAKRNAHLSPSAPALSRSHTHTHTHTPPPSLTLSLHTSTPVVKRAVVVSMDRDDAQRAMVSDLFAFLLAEGVVSPDGFEGGFRRLREALPDLTLDVPSAPVLFATITEKAVAAGCIVAPAAAAAP